MHWFVSQLEPVSVLISIFRYESLAWIPNCIGFIVMLAVGGKHLNPSKMLSRPVPEAATVISFASLIASSVLSWCTMTPDYGVYHNAKASRWAECDGISFS